VRKDWRLGSLLFAPWRLCVLFFLRHRRVCAQFFLRSSVGAASQALRSRERQGVLIRVARGVWCVPSDPRFNRFLLVNYLNGAHRAYVSFVSALHLHGIIEQIPHVVYAAATN